MNAKFKEKTTIREYLENELKGIYICLKEHEIAHLNGEISKSQLKKYRALCFNAKREVAADIIKYRENNQLDTVIEWDSEKGGYRES